METNEVDKFELINYDVWGNSEDGYEINQAFYTGKHIELRELSDWTDKEQVLAYKQIIVDKLKELNSLSDNVTLKDIEIDLSHYEVIYISDSLDGYPLYELRLLEA